MISEEEKKAIDKLNSIKVSGDKEIIYNFETGTILNLIEKQNKELEEKETLYQKALTDLVIAEKMIDEMADLFLTIAKNNPGTIFHYLEKDGFSTKECSPCGEQKKDKNWTCAECFKEYFRKKVENE